MKSCCLFFLGFGLCAVFLVGCGTVQNDVLIAYADRPLLAPEQSALIDWGVKGEHSFLRRRNHQFHLLRVNGFDANNVGTMNGYKRIAVKPGHAAVVGNLIMDGNVTRTVPLQAGHVYEFLQVPFVQLGDRILTPEEAARSAASATIAVVPELGRAARDHEKMLLGLFYSPTLKASSSHQAFLDVLKRYKCRGLLVVKDKTTGAWFTSEDPESKRVFALLRPHIPAMVQRAGQPVILLPGKTV